MSLLDNMSLVGNAPIAPMQITVIGDAGTAKTSLASLFPSVLIIRAEDGTKSIDNKDSVMQTPVLNNSASVMQWLSDIYASQDSGIKTIAFDSITKLNAIIEDEIVASDRKHPKSINTALGGYGAGHNAVAKVHRDIKAWCDLIASEKGVHIVFIAHSKIENLDSPDLEAYTRYGLKMNRASLGIYVDDIDMVCQLRLNTIVMTGKGELDKAKAKTTGGISILAHAQPSNVTKNRYDIHKEIPFVRGVFPFQSIIDTGRYVENYNVDKATGEIK